MAGARGEGTIPAGDHEVSVLFTNRALADAEQKLGKSILSVLQAMTTYEVGIGDLAIMLRVGMEAARRDAGEPGPSVALNTAWAVMDEAGFGTVLGIVLDAMAAVLAYGSAEGEEGESPNP